MTSALLKLTDGTTTLNFDSGDNIKTLQYLPGSGKTEDGIVEDIIQLALVGSKSTQNNNRAAINLLLDQAKNYAFNQQGPRIFLLRDLDQDGTDWRAEITDGYIEAAQDRYTFQNTQYLYIVLHVSHVPYFDGEETELPLSNSSASNNTTGINVDNASDGSHENFVDIAAADVVGDLPASLKLEITNNTNGSARNKEFYIWHNVYSSPSSFAHMLEAEDATGATVSAATDATCQNGSKATLAWTSTSETKIATWSLSDSLITNAAGGRFAALARWKGAFPYTDCWLRLRLLDADGNELKASDLSLVASTRELTVLWDFQLPPHLAGQSSIKGEKLALYGYRNVAGTHSLVLDYLQLSPIAGGGGWKRFNNIGDGIAYTETLIHDDLDELDYRVDTGSKKNPGWSAFGGPILLIPNKNQRLYFNQCDKNGAAKIDQTFTVKASYRPRRSSL